MTGAKALFLAVFGAVVWKTGVAALVLQNPFWFFGIAMCGCLWGVGSWARRAAKLSAVQITEHEKQKWVRTQLGDHFDYRDTPNSLPVRFDFSSVLDLDSLHVGSLVPVCSQRTSPQCCGANLLVTRPDTGQIGYYCKECVIQYTQGDTERIRWDALAAIRRRISELRREVDNVKLPT